MAAFIEQLRADLPGANVFSVLRYGMQLLGAEPMVFLDEQDVRTSLAEALADEDATGELLDLRPVITDYDDLTWTTQCAQLFDDSPPSEWWQPLLSQMTSDGFCDSVWDDLRDLRKELLQDAITKRMQEQSLNPV